MNTAQDTLSLHVSDVDASASTASQFDVCIVGAGIIGLSLAAELHLRGARVIVLEQGHAMREASWAAAGMLAALDPANPPSLHPLAHLSLKLYPEFLRRISQLSGEQVRIRTTSTLLASPDDGLVDTSGYLTPADLQHLAPAVTPGEYLWSLLDEPSLDPRDICSALPKAIRAMGIEMREHSAWLSTKVSQESYPLHIQSVSGTILARTIVHCTGAWASSTIGAASGSMLTQTLRPRKGQMLCLRLPSYASLPCVVHAPGVYIVPRGDGRVVIGSTIEDVGFDKTLHDAALADLLARATRLVPALAHATEVERWAGLRPGSPDLLPVLGAIPGAPSSFLAAGHFRMGILLAPATARLMAQLILGQPLDLDLTPFAPQRSAA